MEAAERDGERDAGFLLRFPHLIERHGQISAGHRGVAAEPARCADMVVAAMDARLRIAEIPRNAAADRQRKSGFDQSWRLLDMHFEEGADRRRIELPAALPDRVDVAAAIGDVARKR